MRCSRAASSSGLSLVHRAGHDHDVRAVHVLRRVAERNLRAEPRQVRCDIVRLQVRPLHLVAEVDQHFGDAAHATAADADEVDRVDPAHAVRAHRGHAALLAYLRHDSASSSAALRFREQARAVRHGEQLAATGAQLLQLLGKTLRRDFAVRNQDGRAFGDEIARVVCLVIVDRRGKRHEDRADAGGRQLGDRQRTGAADDEIGPARRLQPCLR